MSDKKNGQGNLAALILERELRGLDGPVGGPHAVDAAGVHGRPRDGAAHAEDVLGRSDERKRDERRRRRIRISGQTGERGPDRG